MWIHVWLWVYISSKDVLKTLQYIGTQLLVTIHCRILHLLNHIANLLKPSTNFVECPLLKPNLSKQGSLVRRGLYPRKLKVFLLVKNTYKWKLSQSCPCIIYSRNSDCKAAYDCKQVSSRSIDRWSCRYVCRLLAGCTLGYRCRSLWIHTLYQRHFADHLQEDRGQDYSWQLQGGRSYSFLVATMQAHAIQHKHKGTQLVV